MLVELDFEVLVFVERTNSENPQKNPVEEQGETNSARHLSRNRTHATLVRDMSSS